MQWTCVCPHFPAFHPLEFPKLEMNARHICDRSMMQASHYGRVAASKIDWRRGQGPCYSLPYRTPEPLAPCSDATTPRLKLRCRRSMMKMAEDHASSPRPQTCTCHVTGIRRTEARFCSANRPPETCHTPPSLCSSHYRHVPCWALFTAQLRGFGTSETTAVTRRFYRRASCRQIIGRSGLLSAHRSAGAFF